MRKYIPKNSMANDAVEFMNCLQVSDETDNLKDDQEKFVRQLFGCLDDDGNRQYRKALFTAPRGEGKTTMCAKIALYSLICLPDGQEIFCIGSDGCVTSILFNTMKKMVLNNSLLSSICDIVESQKRIYCKNRNSFISAFSNEANKQCGLNPSVLLFDEMEHFKSDNYFHLKNKTSLFVGFTSESFVCSHHFRKDKDSLSLIHKV